MLTVVQGPRERNTRYPVRYLSGQSYADSLLTFADIFVMHGYAWPAGGGGGGGKGEEGGKREGGKG
jgi:hypothetical protein